MRLDLPGVPLFLQFKLCDQMTRRTCREARQRNFSVPCYRMHLRPARSSRQHEMLLDLETAGQDVYYCAPQFHKPTELNSAFLQRAVRDRSVWIRPSDIGVLPDDRDHHMSFEFGGPWTLFSDPKPIDGKRVFEDVERHLADRLREQGPTPISETRLDALADVITRIADERRHISQRERDAFAETVPPTEPLQRVAYYGSVFLDSQLFVVQERQTT